MKNKKKPFSLTLLFFLAFCLFSCENKQKEEIIFLKKLKSVEAKYKYHCDTTKYKLDYNIKTRCGVFFGYNEERILKSNFKDYIMGSVDMYNVNENIISNLFKEIDLISVHHISMTNCDLGQNEQALYGFKKIFSIYMNDCAVEKLSGDNFSQLHDLFIRRNRTAKIELGYLPCLKRLEIYNSPLKRFDIPAKNLPMLYQLILANTEIDSIEDINLEGYPKNMWCLISARYKNKRIKNPKNNQYETKEILTNKVALDSVALRKKYPHIRFSFHAPPKYPIVPKYDF